MQEDKLETGFLKEIQFLIVNRKSSRLICELMEFEGEIIWETDKPNSQPRRCLDTERAKQAFGLTAEMEFEQGLRNTIDWYRQHAQG